jgi:L-rhamnose mutarotase
MKYRIVQYIQPWEIDNFERQVNKMIESSYYIQEPKDVVWDVTLNLSIVNWENSKIDKSYFVNKFEYLRTIVDYYFTAEFDYDVRIQGSGDKKRVCAEKIQDYSIWLDSDIFFPTQTLPMLIHATKQITETRYILTPEIVRWWDASWDCIVNKKYLSEPHEMRMSFDIYSLESSVEEEVNIKSIEQLKFGAGWFTLLSQRVLDEIKIPIEGGSYGVDDTYFMICGQMIGIRQFVLSGITIAEMSTRFLKNKDYIKPLLDVIIADKNRISPDEFDNLIKKFYNENNILHT